METAESEACHEWLALLKAAIGLKFVDPPLERHKFGRCEASAQLLASHRDIEEAAWQERLQELERLREGLRDG